MTNTIRKQIVITEEQNKFIKSSSFNFSALIRNQLQKLIEEQKEKNEPQREN